jgi:DNA-binding NarL/FixJ family response regulator
VNTIRVLLADDHTLVRAGLRTLVELIQGVEVVAETGDGREALDLIRALKPDVALMDIGMPGLNGLELAVRVAAECPATRVIVLSMHTSEAYVSQALRAGVAGYLIKDASVAELPLALSSVARGEMYLSPAISKTVVEALRGLPAHADHPLEGLTPRQREILQLIAEGHSTKEIAWTLKVSGKTVETHRAQLMDRLGIYDVAGLVRFAIRCGLISADS